VTDFWPIQQALLAALEAAPATYPAFDHVPQGTPAPYLVLGEVTQNDAATLTEEGASFTLTVHGFSAYAGKRECLQMQAFVRARLHRQAIAGTWQCIEEFATVVDESSPDEPMYHLVVRYRIGA
jgi:hypothetical protein